MTSNTQNTQSKTDIQQAADQVNPSKLTDNLNAAEQVGGDSDNNAPQPLSDKQATPFIDESLRTDK